MSSPSNIQKGIYSDSGQINPYLDGSLLKEVNHGGETVFPSTKPKWPTPQVYSNPEFYHSARVREYAPVEGAVLEISTDGGETWSKCPVVSTLNKDNVFSSQQGVEVLCRYAEDSQHLHSDTVSCLVTNMTLIRPPLPVEDVEVTVDSAMAWIGDLSSKWSSADKSRTVNVIINGSTTESVANILGIVTSKCNSNYNLYFNCETSDNTITSGLFWNDGYIRSFNSDYIYAIGSSGFYACPNLERVIVPNCKEVNSRGLFRCSNLELFYNLANLEYIGSESFFECRLLKEFSVFGSSLSDRTFQRCSSINEVLLFHNAFDYSFSECTSVKHVVFNEGVSNVPEGCFNNCYDIEFVDFSRSNVQTVGQDAFSGVPFSKCIFVFKDRAQYELLAPQIGEDIKYYINNDG